MNHNTKDSEISLTPDQRAIAKRRMLAALTAKLDGIIEDCFDEADEKTDGVSWTDPSSMRRYIEDWFRFFMGNDLGEAIEEILQFPDHEHFSYLDPKPESPTTTAV